MTSVPPRAPDCPVDRVVHGDRPCEGPATYYCDSDLWGSECRRYFERLARGEETPAEQLARRHHEAWNQHASTYGLPALRPWERIPWQRRRLAIAAAQELIDAGAAP